MLREVAKRAAERCLVAGGFPGYWLRRRQPAHVVLAYHNILADDVASAGERSLHLSRQIFSDQLDVLCESFDVVPLADLVRSSAGRRARPRAAITFDDAYRGAVQVGLEELTNRGLPGTVFVAPGLLGKASLWWDRYLNEAHGALGASFRNEVLQRFAGREEYIETWACRSSSAEPDLGPLYGVCSEAELIRAAQLPAITFASHTWSHPNLTALPADQLAAELVQPLRWLRERFTNVIDWLSYPYGMANPTVEAAAASAGYVAALLVNGGLSRSLPENAYRWPRLNVPAGLSTDGFRIRVSGIRTR